MTDDTTTTPATLDDVLAELRSHNQRPAYQNGRLVAAMTAGEFRHKAVARLTFIAVVLALMLAASIAVTVYTAKQYTDTKAALQQAIGE